MQSISKQQSYIERMALLQREIRRQRAHMSGNDGESRREARAWAAHFNEHQRRLASISGGPGTARAIIEDLRFDFTVLAMDLRRFFTHHAPPRAEGESSSTTR